jgi:hypothetical protein
MGPVLDLNLGPSGGACLEMQVPTLEGFIATNKSTWTSVVSFLFSLGKGDDAD